MYAWYYPFFCLSWSSPTYKGKLDLPDRLSPLVTEPTTPYVLLWGMLHSPTQVNAMMCCVNPKALLAPPPPPPLTMCCWIWGPAANHAPSGAIKMQRSCTCTPLGSVCCLLTLRMCPVCQDLVIALLNVVVRLMSAKRWLCCYISLTHFIILIFNDFFVFNDSFDSCVCVCHFSYSFWGVVKDCNFYLWVVNSVL